jgi:hypothetical protein
VRKTVIIACVFVFIFQLILITYFQRGILTAKYDAQYWKDRYEHSQYQLPLSKRIIGDDGLFAYAGYRLINGDNPFSINNDKPPVAKYLFGLSILLFRNPLYVVFFLGLSTLIIFYFTATHFLKDNGLALLATAFLFLDPLFFSQFWITGLDLTQLFFLLLNLLLLINIKSLRGWNFFIILGSGLSLGLFIEVKPPIILPVIFLLETAFFFQKKLKKEYLFFIVGILLGSLLPYSRFIYLGNGLIDVLKVHKFMSSIYLQSELKAHVGAIWLSLLAGKFPNITTGSLINIAEWWIMWPILTFLGIGMAIFSFFVKKVPIFNKGIGAFLLVSLIIFTFIPSYPRYLVLILPFLYLFAISFSQRFLSKGRYALYSILIIAGIINSFLFLFPKQEGSLNGFYYNLSHLFFHDIYQENIAEATALGLTRNQFRYIANKTLENAGVKEIVVKELKKNIPILAAEGTVTLRFTYKTQDLGVFHEDKIITLIKKDDKWKIKWDWNIILNDFRPNYQLESQIILGKRGSIINNSGVYLAQDFDGYLLSVNPEKISLPKEQAMLKTFSNYAYRGDVYFQNAYLENVLPDRYVPIFTTSQYISLKEKNTLLSYPGITLTPYKSRVFLSIDAKSIENTFYKECCTRIYSSFNYHGIEGVEKEFDRILWGYSGGKILMKDSKGAIIKVVFEKNKKDGQDVILQ